RLQSEIRWRINRRKRTCSASSLAKPAPAADRAGILAFRAMKSIRPARLLSFVIRRPLRLRLGRARQGNGECPRTKEQRCSGNQFPLVEDDEIGSRHPLPYPHPSFAFRYFFVSFPALLTMPAATRDSRNSCLLMPSTRATTEANLPRPLGLRWESGCHAVIVLAMSPDIYQVAGLWKAPTASVSVAGNCEAARFAVEMSGEAAATLLRW